jgi:hypothetical protein
MLAPAVEADVGVAPPAMPATAAVLAPTLSSGVSITATVIAATAAMLVPTVTATSAPRVRHPQPIQVAVTRAATI